MARIKITDLAQDAKISKEQMKAVCGGGISIFGGGANAFPGVDWQKSGGFSRGGASYGSSSRYGSIGGGGGGVCGISIFE